MLDFNLRKFESNCSEIEKMLELPQQSTSTRILGITWDKAKDTFVFSNSRFDAVSCRISDKTSIS